MTGWLGLCRERGLKYFREAHHKTGQFIHKAPIISNTNSLEPADQPQSDFWLGLIYVRNPMVTPQIVARFKVHFGKT